MIVEVRSYRLKRGTRDRFLEIFRNETIPLQRAIGIRVLGPFLDIEDPDSVVWARAFPSLEARETMKHELYEGDKWKNELEAIVMPMLESYSSTLSTMPDWFVNELPPCAPS
jgi:hypothetical protein